MSRLRRRRKAERLRDRKDVRRLARMLERHDWLVDPDGVALDLAVGQRLEAVTALGSIDAEEAERAVVTALHDDDPRVIRAAVDALGPTPGPAAAKALAQAAGSWRAPILADARRAAIEVLVGLDDEVLAVVFADSLLTNVGNAAIAGEESAALRRLFSVPLGRASEVLADHLTTLLTAGDEAERGAAEQILGALRVVGVDALVATLGDPPRRPAACAALGAMRESRAVPALLTLLEDPDPSTRVVAARALGDIRDPAALEGLIATAGDSQAEVRDAAIDALNRLGSVVDVFGSAALVETLETRLQGLDLLPGARAPDNGVGGRSGRGGHERRTLLRRLLGRHG